MNEITEIQPSRELKFTFEVKRQSTCNVQLINKTDKHVAFKVKTTNPKKYCVRPNVGVIRPKETCEFVVLMQAQRSPPADMICKDKFLVQSTIVPAGTNEDDITSKMFSKESGKYIEERKLKVILVNPPYSSEISPMNGKEMQVPPVEVESSVAASELLNRTERQPPHHVDVEDDTVPKTANKEVRKPMADARLEAIKIVEAELAKSAASVSMRGVESQPIEVVESKGMEPRMVKEAGDLRLANVVKEMKSKLLELELKFGQAEKTISKLMEERRSSVQEIQLLQHDLALSKTQRIQKTIHEGFPLLFMCMVAMISIVIGYLLHH